VKLYLGLDIGTTSVCAVVTEEGGAQRFCRTLPNSSGFCVQDPLAIWAICTNLLEEAFAACPGISHIGLCGQMHGMLYLDETGAPVSPLYTWQDTTGNEPQPCGETYAQELSVLTGYPMASGFGCTTLFAHLRKGAVPPGAAQICTIHDYVAMRLCGLSRPVMHASDAASFGLFDLLRLQFDERALFIAGLPKKLLPKVTGDWEVLGAYRGIPVTVAIGDNQASFLGAAEDPQRTVLVNVGTGSQCSMATPYLAPEQIAPGAELRPLRGKSYLYVGSALCGGRAFAAAKDFFAQCAQFLTGTALTDAEVYAALDRLLAGEPPQGEPPVFDPRFAGTRQDPSLRASVTGLGTDNVTPAHLLRGLVQGMASEIHGFYRDSGLRREVMAGAGNGLRKNAALRRALEQAFGMPLRIPPWREEAARGAAKLGRRAEA